MKSFRFVSIYAVVLIAGSVLAQDTDGALAGLPQAAVESYPDVNSTQYSSEAEVEWKKWLVTWRRHLLDPNKALVELDYVKFLLLQVSEDNPRSRWILNIKSAQAVINAIKSRQLTDVVVRNKLAEVHETALRSEKVANK